MINCTDAVPVLRYLFRQMHLIVFLSLENCGVVISVESTSVDKSR